MKLLSDQKDAQFKADLEAMSGEIREMGKANTKTYEELLEQMTLASFGAPMWETLARKVPWSWLTGITLKQALCRDRMTLPMLEIWPGEIESVMKKCFNDAVDRPNFCSVHEYLSTIENSGGGLTSEVLDGAFPDWCEVHLGSIQNATQRVRTRAQTRREREVEQYGYQIAKQLELDRDIRRRSRRYSRPTWAKEVALTRAIARDLERVQNYTWKTYDTASKDKTSIRRGRKHSVLNEETFDRLLTTSSKYLKKDWSKVLHGMGKLKKLDERIKGKADSREISKGREVGSNFMDETLQGSANTEACRSRRKLVTSELTEKHPPNTHSVAIALALASSSSEVVDTRHTSKVAGLGSNVESNTLHCSVNTEPCGSRKKSLASELTEVRRPRAHSVVKVEVSSSAEIADTQDTSEINEFGSKIKSNTFYCGANAEPCGSGKNSLTSEFAEKRRRRAHSAAKVEASQSVEVAVTRDTSEGKEFGSNLKGNNLHCSVNAEASRSGENYVTPEVTEESQLKAHSVVEVEASPSADVADTRDTSKATEFGNKLEDYTLHCSLNAVECGSRRNFVTSELVEKRQLDTHSVTKGEAGSSVAIADTRDNSEVTAFGSTQQCNVNSEAYRSRKKSAVSEIPEKGKLDAHLAVKAERSAVRSSKLMDLPRETQTKGTEGPESLSESLTESRGGRCNDVCVKSFHTKSLAMRPIGEHQNIHRMRSQTTSQVEESLFDEFSSRDNDELAGNIDESESVVRGKTLPSISGGSLVMKSNILRHLTETTSDISKKFDEAKDGKREGATVQLSPAFSGVRKCEPRKERLSSLRQELGGRNSFNPKTMSFGTKETSSVLYFKGDTPISRKKLKKVRSNFLGQEPTEALTIKCNSLMTESVGRDDSALGNPKLLTYSWFAVGSK
ncbi:Mitogen-activated protein kinase kinase kinase MLK4 [Stylophora pistillata]|uniref:Mitogen-activated protein kinase kinase kinase MLK4 n=1 Tax=Stylophora pistillata TaxID=50429 RepID=A0A2B4S3Y3_STYPI|nr:Mitogen-activated protein kinase kinase kinase MLK4 [Stylophora pistillata]